MRTTGRGRPLKFGRRSQLLAITLPDDVVQWLKSLHPDPAWAIVSLFEQSAHSKTRRRREVKADVELAKLSPRRALIVVDPKTYRSLPGISVIPVAAGRAFLAFDEGRGVADLELAIRDRLDDPGTDAAERKALETLRRQVRDWRQSRRFRFSTRSIILVDEITR